MVPLVSAKREYVLLPPGRPGGIGMDDPLLASRLGATALDLSGDGPPQSLAYRVAAGTGEAADSAEGVRRPLDILLESARAEERDEPRRNPLREFLVTALLTTVGVAAAYHLTLDQGLDPTLWVGAGGLWGLIMGWLCIQWMRQRQ